jgi:hypothetical protein
MTNLASTATGSDGAGQIGYTLGSHSANTVGSALDTAAALETALPLNTLATNGAGLMGWASTNAYAAGTAGAGLNTLNVFDTNLGLSTLASNGAGLVGYSSGNSYTTGTVGYALNNFSIGSNFNKMNFNLYNNASPSLGDTWLSSTRQTLSTQEGVTTGNSVTLYKSGILATNNTNYNVTFTSAATYYDILASSNLTAPAVLPANFFILGKTIKIEMWFTFAPSATSALFVDTTFGAISLVIQSAPLTSGLTYSGKYEVVLTCITTGGLGFARMGFGQSLILSTPSGATPSTTISASTASNNFATTNALTFDTLAQVSAGTGVIMNVVNVLVSVLD